MNAPPRISIALLGVAVLVGSCVSKDSPTGVGRGGPLDVPVRPALVPSPADAGAAPVDRIRARVARIPDGTLIGESVTEVDPNAESWEIELSADPGPSGSALARIFLTLLNVTGDVETVQFSGPADFVALLGGRTTEPAEIPILRGPIANHYVTAVDVSAAPDTLAEASTGTLRATASTTSTASPRVFWTVLDSAVLSVADSVVTGVAAGVGRVVASAGRYADTAVVVVRPPVGAPDRLDLSLAKTADVTQPLEGEPVTFTVSVVNHGPVDATDVVVFDTLPAAFTGATHIVSAGALDGDTLWTIPSLAAGDTAQWTADVVVAAGSAGSSATNRAVLRSLAQVDTVPANDSAAATLSFPLSAVPVVEISSPADGEVFDPGDLVTFQATANDAEEGDLTGSITWTSSLDGSLGSGGSFEMSQLTTGVHTIAASVTDQDGGTGADTVRITVALITTPQTLNVPFGASASLPITLAAPAQAGGLTVSVSSNDDAIARPTSSTVFIPGGALSANAVLEGIEPGTVDVTVSHPQFGAAVTSVSVTANLDVVPSALRVPMTFPQPIDIELRSQGAPTAAPPGGIAVTLTSLDPTCAVATPLVTIQAGLAEVTDTIAYGGSAALPCETYIRATAPSLVTDSIRVTVDPTPALSMSNSTLGAGLQFGFVSALLGTSAHGGVTVRIQSDDPATTLVSPDATTPGTAFIDVAVPNGQNRAFYYVQALEGITGNAVVSATAPGFTDGTSDIEVVEPATQIAALNTAPTALDGEDPFIVYVGTPNPDLVTLTQTQAVRAGGDTLTVTLTSSEDAVGILRTATDTATSVTVPIAPGSINSPSSVASGGVALFPVGAGSTTIAASIPGFLATDASSPSVNVTTPGIGVFTKSVGSGLQVSAPWATLGASQHGGATVTITSADPELVLLSPNASTAPQSSIQVTVPNGQIRANYWVHGTGQLGSTYVRVSSPGFATDSAEVTVVQPAYEIQALNLSTTSFSPDDPFYVRVGIPNASSTALFETQSVRNDQPALTVTITSDNVAVADLVTLPDSTSPVTVTIEPEQFLSPTSVAAGGVALEPVGAGSATISARIPGSWTPLPLTDRTVTVSAPGISIQDRTVGAGLQYGILRSTLGATDHPGVTVRVESADPSVMLVSSNDSTTGQAFVDIPVAAGSTAVDYWVHGVDGQTGDVALRISAPGFVSDSATVSVVEAAYDIVGLDVTSNTFAADDPLWVRIGVPLAGNQSLWIRQARRAGQPPLDLTVTSSNPGVGSLKTQSIPQAQLVPLQIPTGSSQTPTTVALGGAAFDALANGSTTVSAQFSGLTVNQTTAGAQTIEVSAPQITVQDQTVGAGLQSVRLTAQLESGNHGGVTVTLRSSNPDVFRVSPNDSTPGTESIQVAVAAGQTAVPFYLQGVEGAQGTATLTVSAPGFTNSVSSVEVVPPALDLQSLSTQYAADAASDAFWVRLGVPLPNDTGIWIQQAVRAGAPSALTATVTTSNPAAAQLVTTGQSGGSVTVTIEPGQFRSPTTLETGGVLLDPVGSGTTSIQATIPGVTTTTAGTRSVTINP